MDYGETFCPLGPGNPYPSEPSFPCCGGKIKKAGLRKSQSKREREKRKLSSLKIDFCLGPIYQHLSYCQSLKKSFTLTGGPLEPGGPAAPLSPGSPG